MKLNKVFCHTLIVQVVSSLFILLFVYSAVSKLLDFEDFRVQLAQSPLLSAYAGIIAPSIIIFEILIAILLCFRIPQLLGLYASFNLMIAFTEYIFLILNFSDSIPCSCGGIIEKLGWTEHLVLNVAFAVLALVAIIIIEKSRKTRSRTIGYKVVFPTLVIIGGVWGLFLSSEHIIYTENPFIRRYSLGVVKTTELDLGESTYYFAGVNADTIYLGNYNNPLKVMLLDKALTKIAHRTVISREDDLPSVASQIRISATNFYLIDGHISRILAGSTKNWVAKQRWDGSVSFSNYQLTVGGNLIFRTIAPGKYEHILGCMHLTDSLPYIINPGLLEKQSNGDFDTDGILCYDKSRNKIVYTYHYRNSYLVIDSLLKLEAIRNTIDTTSQAQLVVRTIDKGLKRILISSLMVNATAFAQDGLLYVLSMIKGLYEPDRTWAQTETIDVYDLSSGNYRTSFYVYNSPDESVSRFFVLEDNFYGFVGSKLVRYNLKNMLKGYE